MSIDKRTTTINRFSNIPIDHEEINQSELNIDGKTRSNLFAWNGQFSPQFIETLLSYYAKDGFFVVDPFVGSGTVLSECARKGLRSYGIELNASAYYMAKTYEIANLSIEERTKIITAIDSLLKSIKNEQNIIPSILSYIKKFNNVQRNILSTLIILMDVFNNEVSFELLNKKWLNLQTIIQNIPFSVSRISVERGDSRHLGIDDDCADMLITSPPYINVFNYHQKYRRSVEYLGYDVLSIAKSEFGSNRKNRGNRFLTVIQYCIDMALSIKEAIRVCKPKARMIYIVGRESSVLGYSFCNSELIYNIATQIFNMELIIRQERAFKNRFGQIIYEDILSFENPNDIFIEDSEIIEYGRKIAIDMLFEKYQTSTEENKNRELLLDAINKSENVKPSEVYHE
ncbi:DNA methyltransferase [Ruminococcus sp.]|uniref:DNA methyltransferase n=1 Tax=Ruminococcus sp. TaxID=41978 RepID=UPI002E78B4D0|nr:DNA methyltransferase [Ruminococcus sp.]MEE0045497.1 DNA methyltransferase [Ruminococcus sp.]